VLFVALFPPRELVENTEKKCENTEKNGHVILTVYIFNMISGDCE
jgi:hypothetical protein